jgi:predicted amidohydrolase
MTNLFRIALVQKNAVPLDAEKNRLLALEYCRQAKELGANLALFPEMWSTGYARPKSFEPADIRDWRSHALPEDGVYLNSLRKAAKDLQMGIVATCMSEGSPAPQNTAYLIGPDGDLLLKYSKVHTCDFDMERYLEPGDGFYTCDFPLPQGGFVRVGMMICYDREFPESARILMLKGAEIILVPNASAMNAARLNQLSTRAFENMVGVAMANYPGKFGGNSAAYGPVVFTKEETCEDNTVALADHESETICIAEFDLNALRDYRSRECWGNAYRKPATYGALVETRVEPPFRRKPRP